jgi:RecA-family ATPase
MSREASRLLSSPEFESRAVLQSEFPPGYIEVKPTWRPNGVGGEHGASNVSDVADLPIVCAASFAGKPVPERRWIVRDMIPDKTVTLVSGDGGVGKSLLIGQLGVAVATEREWIGLLPEGGPVIFASAEDDLDELHRRTVAIANAEDIDIARLTDLHFVPLAGADAVMGAPEGKTGVIRETAIWRGLATIVERIKPKLVILDTLADVFAGNEIVRREARQFIGILRGLAIEHELALVLLAHPSLSGMISGSGTSGSTAWNNSVRSRLYLETIKGDDGREIDANLRVLRTMNANYDPVGAEIRLRWKGGCFIVKHRRAVSISSLTMQKRNACSSTCLHHSRLNIAMFPRSRVTHTRHRFSRNTPPRKGSQSGHSRTRWSVF